MSNGGKIAKAGKLICVDSGEYSDYCVLGFFVVLKDFDPVAELAKHLKKHKDQAMPFYFEKDSYLSSLIENGLIMEIDYGTLYVGAYCSHDSLSFTPAS